MLKTLLIISTFSVVALASRLTILTSSISVSFKGKDPLDAESLADVFSASLGYSVTQPTGWTGLYVNDPFNPASGAATIVVDGIADFKLITSEKTHSYELIGSGAQESLDSFVFRVQEHSAEAVDLDLTTGFDQLDQYTSILGVITPSVGNTLSTLKPSTPEQKLFLEQISVIDALADKIKSLEKLPKYITIRLSMTPLITTLANPVVTDALTQLSTSINGLIEAIDKAYNKNAVVAVVTIADDNLTRRKRATSGARADPIPAELNLALSYSDDYPVIFNIILWFSVVLTFSLLAISYTIGYMDPGRDSIIYRMTSTRMKKDN